MSIIPSISTTESTALSAQKKSCHDEIQTLNVFDMDAYGSKTGELNLDQNSIENFSIQKNDNPKQKADQTKKFDQNSPKVAKNIDLKITKNLKSTDSKSAKEKTLNNKKHLENAKENVQCLSNFFNKTSIDVGFLKKTTDEKSSQLDLNSATFSINSFNINTKRPNDHTPDEVHTSLERGEARQIESQNLTIENSNIQKNNSDFFSPTDTTATSINEDKSDNQSSSPTQTTRSKTHPTGSQEKLQEEPLHISEKILSIASDSTYNIVPQKNQTDQPEKEKISDFPSTDSAKEKNNQSKMQPSSASKSTQATDKLSSTFSSKDRLENKTFQLSEKKNEINKTTTTPLKIESNFKINYSTLAEQKNLFLNSNEENLSASILSASIFALHKSNQEGISLKLDQPNLGQIDIQIKMTPQGSVNVTFVPSSVDAAHALQSTLPQLDVALAQSGLSLGQAEIGGQFSQPGRQEQQHSQYAQNKKMLSSINENSIPSSLSSKGLSFYA